jgi:hypothetical protein
MSLSALVAAPVTLKGAGRHAFAGFRGGGARRRVHTRGLRGRRVARLGGGARMWQHRRGVDLWRISDAQFRGVWAAAQAGTHLSLQIVDVARIDRIGTSTALGRQRPNRGSMCHTLMCLQSPTLSLNVTCLCSSIESVPSVQRRNKLWWHGLSSPL